MDMITRYFRLLWIDFGHMATRLDHQTVGALAVLVMIAGWIFLRGNLIRST